MSGYIAAAGAINNNGGTPEWLFQGSRFAAALADGGIGDWTTNLRADAGEALTESMMLAQVREAMAASGMIAAGALKAATTTCGITQVKEAAMGGASVRADGDVDVVQLALGNRFNEAQIVGIADIGFAGGVPSVAFDSGILDATTPVVDNAQGDTTVNLVRGYAANECVILVQPVGAVAASTNRVAGIVHTSATAKRITVAQEAAMGGASTLVDNAFKIIVLNRHRNHVGNPDRLFRIAWGKLNMAGAAPSWVVQSGDFTDTFTDHAAGDVTVNLVADRGMDGGTTCEILTVQEAQAASGLSSCGLVHTSATAKRITCTQEQAGGAASALTDRIVGILLVQRVG